MTDEEVSIDLSEGEDQCPVSSTSPSIICKTEDPLDLHDILNIGLSFLKNYCCEIYA